MTGSGGTLDLTATALERKHITNNRQYNKLTEQKLFIGDHQTVDRRSLRISVSIVKSGILDTKRGIMEGVKEPRMNVKPINDALLVELIESESGVAIATDDAHKSITRGKVIAVSDNPLWVQGNGYSIQNDGTGFKDLMARISGKTVYFRRYADQDCGMSQNGIKYALIRLADVMGVVE